MNPKHIVHVILTESFFANIPDNSYIQILKPCNGQRIWVSINTVIGNRCRAISSGVDLQSCIDELTTAKMRTEWGIETQSKKKVTKIETIMRTAEQRRDAVILKKVKNK